MSKRISVQWRITILTALLIAAACVSLNLLLFYSGSDSMDALNGFVVEYKTGNQQEMTIEIPQENMQAFFSGFSQQVSAEKVRFERMGWCITALVTLLSAVIAYFVSGRALKPLGDFARQTGQINEESLTDTRLSEDTTAEFRQLSRSVNAMLDRLAQSFDTQRQFTGNAAHELRTPLALIQTRLELFAAEHPQMDAETAALLRFEQEQLERLSALARAPVPVPRRPLRGCATYPRGKTAERCCPGTPRQCPDRYPARGLPPDRLPARPTAPQSRPCGCT